LEIIYYIGHGYYNDWVLSPIFSSYIIQFLPCKSPCWLSWENTSNVEVTKFDSYATFSIVIQTMENEAWLSIQKCLVCPQLYECCCYIFVDEFFNFFSLIIFCLFFYLKPFNLFFFIYLFYLFFISSVIRYQLNT